MDEQHLKDLNPGGVSGAVRCLICLNPFRGQPVASPQPCDHVYCLACITEWAKISNSCPVDRLKFAVLYQRSCVGGDIRKIIAVEPNDGLEDEGRSEELSVCEECGRSDRRHLMLLCSACDSSRSRPDVHFSQTFYYSAPYRFRPHPQEPESTAALQENTHHSASDSPGFSSRKLEINLSGKRLKSLPSDLLQKGQDVDKADLEKNRLKKVTGISCLSNLTELILCRNELSEFPKEISELQQLVRLYMNQNNIKSIPDNIFPSLKKLQFLKMSTNKLSQLPSDMNKCETLTYLNLSNNCLKNVQPLVGLRQLNELYLENNWLTELPQALFQSQNLKNFKVHNNRLRKPPEEICLGGLKDIQSYFEMLEDHPFTIRTIKTMFLGSSMAGKSTVCRSLRLGSPVEVDEDDRTVGIEIQEVFNTDGVRFLFWDFAGQEEYYFTHHVFITPQAFVILAVDLSMYDAESFREKVGFWITNIQLKVPNAVVLLLGTHADCCTDNKEVQDKKRDIEERVKQMLLDRKCSLAQQKRNLKDLEDPSLFSEQMSLIERLEDYKLQVLDLIPMDCTEPDDISRLQEYINRVVLDEDKFPFMEQTLPQCYKDVENEIQTLMNEGIIPQHGIVTHEEILDHLNSSDNKLDLDKLRVILQYLHRTGIITWYRDIPDLKDMVFVQPSFLISLFKAIVRHDLVSMLREIPKKDLMLENSLQKHRDKWIEDFIKRATLSNVAVRILVRAELMRSGVEDEELIEEIVGTKKKAGTLIRLLQHFDICLPTKESSPLNPSAPEFCPNKKWEPSSTDVYEPNGACLFLSFLQEDNQEVMQMWGEDNSEDLAVQVYFLPEIPHGFFHRLIIRICSFYSTYWVGKDQCLFTSGNRRLLVKQQVCDDDQWIEIRGKCSDLCTPEEIQKAWNTIKLMMSRLAELTQQWRGLCQYVHSPCKHTGCNSYFEWTDWQDWIDPNASEKFNMDPEEKMTCRNGHTRKTELLFPARSCHL
ncbi:malignant fibrous histiocytoma-amplified sequence 1-like isoform X1 [Silurus asotus]|uniref:Malignant fibrous histiocytoma-amplified sequence 1-like isoform X1 n=1 Tax=Silurus asotus TaxID=30991 RepID=A0AAD5B2G1_SILAS|nr:malignant fibrous histiocytoma-amplified sequence 1-like isoform X1 [Silurus asotus]